MSRSRRRYLVIVALFSCLALWLVACSNNDRGTGGGESTCETAEVGCECDGDEACNAGLECREGFCVDPDASADTGVDSETDAADVSDARRDTDDADTGSASVDNGITSIGTTQESYGGITGVQVNNDGSCVVFETNMDVLGLRSDGRHVYVMDIATEEIELVSVDSPPSGRNFIHDFGIKRSYLDVTDASCSKFVYQRDNSVYLYGRTDETTTFVGSSAEPRGISADGGTVLYTDWREHSEHGFLSPSELYLYDVESGQRRWLELRAPDGTTAPEETHGALVDVATLSADGTRVVARINPEEFGYGGTKAWVSIDAETGNFEWIAPNHREKLDPTNHVNINSDASLMVFPEDQSSTRDDGLLIWNATTEEMTSLSDLIPGDSPFIPSRMYSLSHDETLFFIADGTEIDPSWENAGGTQIFGLDLNSGDLSRISILLDGTPNVHSTLLSPRAHENSSSLVFDCRTRENHGLVADLPENPLGLCHWQQP